MNDQPRNHHPSGGDGNLEQLVHHLVTRTLEDQHSEEARELEKLLTGNPAAQELYSHYMQETSSLRVYASSDECNDTCPSTAHLAEGHSPFNRAATRRYWLYAVAGALAAAVGFVFLEMPPPGDNPADAIKLATVTRVLGVTWSGEEQGRADALTRIGPGQSLQFSSGQIEVVFDSGVELLVSGPADLKIESPLGVYCRRGAVSARVGEGGKGFTIRTPVTNVIDLGTEFAVRIDEDGRTGIAVFEGKVDVTPSDQFRGATTSERLRLQRGDAIAVMPNGKRQRIFSIASRDIPAAGGVTRSAKHNDIVIADVRDNIRDPEAKSFYKVVHKGLVEDATAFVDRRHQWNGIESSGIPDALYEADYIMPFNNDKIIDHLVVTVRVQQPCRLFVFLDNNMKVPDWLSTSFEDTGLDIGLDQAHSRQTRRSTLGVGPGKSIDDTFSVWARTVDKPSEINLGGVSSKPTNKRLGWNMYGIAAAPLDDGRPGRYVVE